MQVLSACGTPYTSDVHSFGTIMYELLTFKDATEYLSTSNVSPHAHSTPGATGGCNCTLAQLSA
jgi:hypothetical protein